LEKDNLKYQLQKVTKENHELQQALSNVHRDYAETKKNLDAQMQSYRSDQNSMMLAVVCDYFVPVCPRSLTSRGYQLMAAGQRVEEPRNFYWLALKVGTVVLTAIASIIWLLTVLTRAWMSASDALRAESEARDYVLNCEAIAKSERDQIIGEAAVAARQVFDKAHLERKSLETKLKGLRAELGIAVDQLATINTQKVKAEADLAEIVKVYQLAVDENRRLETVKNALEGI
jgi:uncharacterized protein (DUF3084 family)